MKKTVEIWVQVGDHEPVRLEKCQSRANAEARIRTYERMDRYEVEVEHYAMPEHGYPVYFVR